MDRQIDADFTIPGFDDVVSTVRSFMTLINAESRLQEGIPADPASSSLMAPYQRCWLFGPPYSGKGRALRLLAEALGPSVCHFVDATALAPDSPASAEVASYLDEARNGTEPRVLMIANGHREPDSHRDSTQPESEAADGAGQEYGAGLPDQSGESGHNLPRSRRDHHTAARRTRIRQGQWRTGSQNEAWESSPAVKIAERIAKESLPVLLLVSSDEEPLQSETRAPKPFETVLHSYLPRKSALAGIWRKALSSVATDDSVDVTALVNLSVGYTANDVAMTLSAATQKALLNQGKPAGEILLGQIDLLGAMEVFPRTIREWEHDRPQGTSMHKHLSAALAEVHPGLAMKPKAQPRDIRYVRRGVREREDRLQAAMHEEMNQVRAKWKDAQLEELH